MNSKASRNSKDLLMETKLHQEDSPEENAFPAATVQTLIEDIGRFKKTNVITGS